MVQTNSMWIDLIDTNCVSSIERVMETIPHIIRVRNYAVITRVDSIRGLSLAIPSLKDKMVRYKLPIYEFGSSLMTNGATIVELAITHHFFNGFDEVWFFDSRPDQSVLTFLQMSVNQWAQSVNMGARQHNLTNSKLDEWLWHYNVMLGLSDGDAMQYITTSHDIAKCLDDIVCT